MRSDQLLTAGIILPLRIEHGEIVVDPGLETLLRQGQRDVRVFGELLKCGILYETEIFRTVLSFETHAEAQRNPKVAEILQQHDLNMRVRFCNTLARFGADAPEVKTELLFTIFGGLHARAVRHPEQERGAMMDTIVPVLSKIIEPSKVSS